MEIKGLNGNYQGQSIPVHGSVVFGRDPKTCSLIFPEGTKGVSRVHCKIKIENGIYTITDLGSSYGTYVNGSKLPPNVPTTLRNGDTFYIGNPENMFSVSEQVQSSVMPSAETKSGTADHRQKPTTDKKSGNIGIIIGIVAAVIVVILGIMVYSQSQTISRQEQTIAQQQKEINDFENRGPFEKVADAGDAIIDVFSGLF